MKTLEASKNVEQWPRHAVRSVECRKRDLVIRLTDWTRDKNEPAYDVECYIGGIYDWNESKVFSTTSNGQTKAKAKTAAIHFAQRQIAKLL